MTPGGESPPAKSAPPPAPADVLGWVAAAESAWFPKEFAAAAGRDRDALTEPLNDLRTAGLVRVADWVKGKGQGYAVTPDGAKAAADPELLARALQSARGQPAPAFAEVPPVVPPPPAPPAGRRRPNAFERGEMAREAWYAPRRPVVTSFLLFANAVWFLVGLVVAGLAGSAVAGQYLREGHGETVLKVGGLFGPPLYAGEWWRLVASPFCHFGILHLLLNLSALVALGPVAEAMWGRWRFAAVYALAGWVGGCLYAALNPLGLAAGASGAVYGVMGCVAGWVWLYREHLPAHEVREWVRRLAGSLVLMLVVNLLPRVGWEAHLGGLAAGLLGAWLLERTRSSERWQRAAGWLGLAGLFALAGGGLWLTADRAPAWQRVRDFATANYHAQVYPALLKADPMPATAPFDETTAALATWLPRRVDAARQKLARTREAIAAAAKLVDTTPARGPDARRLRTAARSYLTEATALADRLDGLFAAARKPTLDDLHTLADARSRLAAALAGYLGHLG